MTVKKWAFLVLLLMAGGMLAIVIAIHNQDREDYLRTAEFAIEKGLQEQVDYSLGKALEKSREVYGEISEETAEVYQMLGSQERDLSKGEEYFERAIQIYELKNREDRLLEVYFERGCRYFQSGEMGEEQAQSEFLRVVDTFDQALCENTDYLCLSYYYLACLEEEPERKVSLLREGERWIDQASMERRAEISEKIYIDLASMAAADGNYEEAVACYEKVCMVEGKNTERMRAEGNYMSALCLIQLGEGEKAKERAEEAVDILETTESEESYRDLSLAYSILALAFANQEPSDEDMALAYGKKALACYENNTYISNEDVNFMGMMKMVLNEMYIKLYPEREEWEFSRWFRNNLKLRANKIQIQLE